MIFPTIFPWYIWSTILYILAKNRSSRSNNGRGDPFFSDFSMNSSQASQNKCMKTPTFLERSAGKIRQHGKLFEFRKNLWDCLNEHNNIL